MASENLYRKPSSEQNNCWFPARLDVPKTSKH
jgi:hypothetical protein